MRWLLPLIVGLSFPFPVVAGGEPTSAPTSAPTYEAPRLPLEPPAAPWRARRRPRSPNAPMNGMALYDLEEWPPEPVSPSPAKPERFAAALRQLCGPNLRRPKAMLYGRWIREIGEELDVDPFLLAAVAYRSSRCDPRYRRGHRGGLVTLSWSTHARFFGVPARTGTRGAKRLEKRAYHYWVLAGDEWQPRTLLLKRYPFRPSVLRRSHPSLYFAAAFLSIYEQQCPDIDSRFGSVPHRHPVSHLVWGDRVDDAGSEDRILRARRRLIGYYLGGEPRRVGTLEGLALYCPLDGAPRKISSGLGDVRGGGHHAHQGVDFASTAGEPVRAVADGVVFRAGVDLPRRGSRPIRPERSRYVPRSWIGRGGLFVMIRHSETIYSSYMHLQRFTVKDGQTVRGGELIGYVGRSGIKRDPAHLHFEIRVKRRPVDPVPLLGRAVFGPLSTYRGRLIHANQPRMWRQARYRRWLRRRRTQAHRARARRARRRKRASRRRRAGPRKRGSASVRRAAP